MFSRYSQIHDLRASQDAPCQSHHHWQQQGHQNSCLWALIDCPATTAWAQQRCGAVFPRDNLQSAMGEAIVWCCHWAAASYVWHYSKFHKEAQKMTKQHNRHEQWQKVDSGIHWTSNCTSGSHWLYQYWEHITSNQGRGAEILYGEHHANHLDVGGQRIDESLTLSMNHLASVEVEFPYAKARNESQGAGNVGEVCSASASDQHNVPTNENVWHPLPGPEVATEGPGAHVDLRSPHVDKGDPTLEGSESCWEKAAQSKQPDQDLLQPMQW